jgi:TetR/AcrR family transcriptional regulator, transcriptional repressor for nem operon
MARPKEFETERVLDKALEVFWNRGYCATSVQDLVDGMGINRQSIYDTFGDKHALYLLTLEHYIDEQAKLLISLLSQPGSVKNNLRQAFEDAANNLACDKNRKGCMVVNSTIELAPHDKAIAELITKNFHLREDIFYQALERGKQQGEFNQTDLRAIARFLNSSLQSLAISAKAGVNQAVLADIVNVILKILD